MRTKSNFFDERKFIGNVALSLNLMLRLKMKRRNFRVILVQFKKFPVWPKRLIIQISFFFSFSGKICIGFDFCFLFKFSSFPLSKRRQIPLSHSKSLRVTENVVDFFFLKWFLMIRFPSKIIELPSKLLVTKEILFFRHPKEKCLPFDPAFSNWV